MEPTVAEPMIPDSQGAQVSTGTVSLVLGAVIGLLLAGFWLLSVLAPGELIRPVGPDLFAAAVFVGVFAGTLLAARLMTVRAAASDGRRGNRVDAIGGALILPLLVSTACLRVGVQIVAFIGTTPSNTPANFTIDGFRTSHGAHYLRVRLGENGRVFSVHVPGDLYSSAQRGDTVTLPVETGRFGIQRAMVTAAVTTADLHHAP